MLMRPDPFSLCHLTVMVSTSRRDTQGAWNFGKVSEAAHLFSWNRIHNEQNKLISRLPDFALSRTNTRWFRHSPIDVCVMDTRLSGVLSVSQLGSLKTKLFKTFFFGKQNLHLLLVAANLLWGSKVRTKMANSSSSEKIEFYLNFLFEFPKYTE